MLHTWVKKKFLKHRYIWSMCQGRSRLKSRRSSSKASASPKRNFEPVTRPWALNPHHTRTSWYARYSLRTTRGVTSRCTREEASAMPITSKQGVHGPVPGGSSKSHSPSYSATIHFRMFFWKGPFLHLLHNHCNVWKCSVPHHDGTDLLSRRAARKSFWVSCLQVLPMACLHPYYSEPMASKLPGAVASSTAL